MVNLQVVFKLFITFIILFILIIAGCSFSINTSDDDDDDHKTAAISIKHNETTIENNSIYDIGDAVIDTTEDNVVTIINTGSLSLDLDTGVSITVTGSGFSLKTDATGIITPGQTADFVVTFTPVAATLYSAVITITGNYHGFTDFTFTIQGTGLPAVTPTPTMTPITTPTPTPTGTSAATPTPTTIPTATPTVIPTPTPTATPTVIPTPTPTATPTSTPTATPTATPTSTPTATPTATPTSTIPPDVSPPIASAPINTAQTLKSGDISTSQVQSNEDGVIYLIKSGIPASAQSELDSAIVANNGFIAKDNAVANTAYTVTVAPSLNDGVYDIVAVDDAGNISSPLAGWLTVDNTVPSGYTVLIDQSIINTTNQTTLSFAVTTTEPSATYLYTIGSSGGGTDVTGDGAISSPGDTISSIDVSGLNDGTLSLSVTLTDPVGNTGSAATDTIIKDTTAPTVGNSGTLTITEPGATTATLNWTKATDLISAQSALQYKVVRADAAPAINTVAEVDAISGADLLQDWTTDIETLAITGLDSNFSHFFNVIVKDEADNKAIYSVFADTSRNSLIGYWPFNGNANDESINSYNGTLYDADGVNGDGNTPPQLTTDRHSTSSAAVRFDGTDDYIILSTAATNISTTFSISLWVWYDNDGSDDDTIISNWGTNTNRFILQIDNTTDYLNAQVTQSDTTVKALTDAQVYPTTAWHHIVLKAGSSNIYLYIDGSQIDTIAYDNTLKTSLNDYISLGVLLDDGASGPEGSTPAYFDGIIDDVRLYDRSLSSNEVLMLYNMEKP